MIVTGTTGTIMMTITIGIDTHPFYFAGYEKINLFPLFRIAWGTFGTFFPVSLMLVTTPVTQAF